MDSEARGYLDSYKPTRVTFGVNCISRVGPEITGEHPGARVLIVTGSRSAERSGSLSRLRNSLESARLEYDVFRGVEPDPSSETVKRIAGKAREGFSVLVPLGGGSTIDATKAANVLTTLGGEVKEYLGSSNISGELDKSGRKLLPVFAVPTTSGTGAEVTKYSVITDSDMKMVMRDDKTIPGRAFVDPELTYSCPPGITATVGLDALAHLLEGYLNNINDGDNPLANNMALYGMRLVFNYLPRAYENPQDKEAREMMSLASVLGGMVINYKPTSIPHGLSLYFHSFMSHGDAVSVILPYAWAYYIPAVESKSLEVASLLGTPTRESPRKTSVEAVRKLSEFIKSLDHPTTLREIPGIEEEDLRKAAEFINRDPVRLKVSPRQIEPEKAAQTLYTILRGAYQGTFDDILKM